MLYVGVHLLGAPAHQFEEEIGGDHVAVLDEQGLLDLVRGNVSQQFSVGVALEAEGPGRARRERVL